jgi:hypothetical protein
VCALRAHLLTNGLVEPRPRRFGRGKERLHPVEAGRDRLRRLNRCVKGRGRAPRRNEPVLSS